MRFALLISVLGLGSVGFADVTDLRITEVNPATGQVEVTNTSVDAYTATGNLPFSHLGDTASFIPVGTVFSAGQVRTFTVSGLNAADSDLWLYKDTNFTDPASIITGLKWGASSGVGRTSVAVAAGIWASISAFVPAQTNASQSLRAVVYDTTAATSWAQGTPTMGTFFGTGTTISNPIPNLPLGAQHVDLQTVASGLASPLTAAQPNDGTNRLFISDQVGLVRVVENGILLTTPALDVRSRLVSNPITGEMGLIGFALHPDFAMTKKLYTHTSEPTSGVADFPTSGSGFHHQGVVAEWTMSSGNPNVVDVTSRRELLRIDQPQSNHNGGALHFGLDGNLYIALGDGGNGDDEGTGHDSATGNGQSLANVLGKILRIQIDGGPFPNGKYGVPADNPFAGEPGIDEIWAYGLRNPYSFGFDRLTGDCWVGDVGQGQIEEVDLVTTGANCGWRLKEGSYFFDPAGNGTIKTIPVAPIPADVLDPVAEYDHGSGVSVIGGTVYRGSLLPGLSGRYVFGEYAAGSAGQLLYLDENMEIKILRIGESGTLLPFYLKGFGQDQSGEIYACGSTSPSPSGTGGVVMKLVNYSRVDDWFVY